MTAIHPVAFEEWLVRYGSAWQAGDARAAVELFSDDAEYYENPFAAPMVGRPAIQRYWSRGAGESQEDVHFIHRSIAVLGDTGLAQWHATFVRVPSGSHVELDGLLIAEFDRQGKCRVFREWWHRREGGAIQAS